MTAPVWSNAQKALQLLALDPGGLGGIWLRARSGPPKNLFVDAARSLSPLHWSMISPVVTDDALFGGIDITQTLATGKPITTQGLINAQPSTLALSNAERTTSALAARLARVLDRSAGHCLIALDEGVEEEAPPTTLTDRLAFHICLDDLRAADCAPIPAPQIDISIADVAMEASAIADLTILAARLGIPGVRAPLFALSAARASAALSGRTTVESEDLEIAAALVFAPRAIQLPEDIPPPDDPAPPEATPETAENTSHAPPEDVLLDAVLAALPPDILEQLKGGKALPQASGNSAQGAIKQGQQRGRPLPPRKAKPDGRRRIELISTLRSAAPWQPMRRIGPDKSRIHIRPEDIHLRRYQSRSDRLLIFIVDASGSAAMNRLAEAKGAVELLLADAYASRDHVSLISYCKDGAELLLPPTKSLVRPKRRLAKLAGGGGTPLAAGLKAGIDTILQARRKGFQPAIVLIADGRANIDLNGTPDRAQALEDALIIARLNATCKAPGVVIDMSKRPETQLRQVSDALNASYIPLPFADAQNLSNLVSREIGSD